MALGVRKREREGEKEPTRSFSKKQETAIAKAIGGSRQPNSGATPWAKGDVKNDLFLIEAKTKTTSSEKITIHKDWIQKNREEAAFMGKKYQALAFSFGPDEENFYVIDEDMFITLLDYLRALQEQ